MLGLRWWFSPRWEYPRTGSDEPYRVAWDIGVALGQPLMTLEKFLASPPLTFAYLQR